MLARVGVVENAVLKNYQGAYPKLFIHVGLGKLPGDYNIKLTPDATPFSISVPRRIPFPLRSKVYEELTRMEQLGVIRTYSMVCRYCHSPVE